MKEMFCFQCQQTAHNTGCEGKAGVCGKKAATADLQDQLTGALIGLAKTMETSTRPVTDAASALVVKSLFATLTNVNFDDAALKELL